MQVSETLKKLVQDGLVDLVPNRGARLTETGYYEAQILARRRWLLELFLEQTLGPGIATTDEIWRMETAVSDQLIELIDEFLGYPEQQGQRA